MPKFQKNKRGCDMDDFVRGQIYFALFYALWTTKLIADTLNISDTAVRKYKQRVKSAHGNGRLKRHGGKVTKTSLSQENKVIQV